jgi:hypothetical protein|nr:MAG TPA: DNA ligase-like protein [Caudoviricetes sp.]
MTIRIRVKAKTEAGGWRTVRIADLVDVSCDCGGFKSGICSHIDAVLIAREQAMVHPDDIEVAQHQAELLEGLIDVPKTWRGTWRRELAWRGISRTGLARRRYVRQSDKPLVAFTGCRNRAAMLAQAQANGWDVTDDPSKYLDVLVAANPTGGSRKLKVARDAAIPIVSPEEWEILMTDGVLPR